MSQSRAKLRYFFVHHSRIAEILSQKKNQQISKWFVIKIKSTLFKWHDTLFTCISSRCNLWNVWLWYNIFAKIKSCFEFHTLLSTHKFDNIPLKIRSYWEYVQIDIVFFKVNKSKKCVIWQKSYLMPLP